MFPLATYSPIHIETRHLLEMHTDFGYLGNAGLLMSAFLWISWICYNINLFWFFMYHKFKILALPVVFAVWKCSGE